MFEWYCQDHACFNPTLVRLRPETDGEVFDDNLKVSIPRWFD